MHPRTRLMPLAGLLAALSADPTPAQPPPPPRMTVSVGAVTLTLEPRRPGLRLLYDGVELVRHSEIIVTTPPWAPHYYVGPTEDAVKTATIEPVPDGRRLRVTHRGEKGSFEATETFTVYADRVVLEFEGRLLKPDAEALSQTRFGGLNPALLIGRTYEATLRDGKAISGTVPVAAQGSELKDTTLASGFTALTFHARIGPVQILVDSPHNLVVYDYRKNRWATADDPYFWFGDMGTRFKTGDTLRYRIEYRLPPRAVVPTTAAPTVVEAAVRSVPNAQTYPQNDPPRIIPRPREARFTDKPFVVPEKLTGPLFRFPPRAAGAAATSPPSTEPPSGRLAGPVLGRCLVDDFRVGLLADPPLEPDPPGLVRVRVTTDPQFPAEGYRLTVTPDGIDVEARSEAGLLFAVQTLRQLITRRTDGAVIIRGAEIYDWPALPLRGVHLFTGGQGADLHERLIRNVLAALKMNHLVVECEYVKWDSTPEIHHPEYGMSKDEARRIVRTAQNLGLEVTPLVNSLGHCQWLFTNDANLDIAEDPEAKWAYCVTNPRTYEVIFGIYAEALELFDHPRFLHVGHDEFTHRGRYPHREESKKYTVEQLFRMDLEKLHAWLAERGVRMMMWGDMLLGPKESPDACHADSVEQAQRLRAALPDDVLITDWHYVAAPPAEYRSLSRFHEAGLQTVAATWNRAENIVNFAKAAYDQKSLGLLQTTWAGYSLDPGRFAKEIQQYMAYVLAAEAAWNADRPLPEPDRYPAGTYFLDLMQLSPLRPALRDGWTLDLSGAGNVPLRAADARGWFELGPDHDLSAVPTGAVTLCGVRFDVAPAALALTGKLTASAALPAAVTLRVAAAAETLVVLCTTNFPCDPGGRVAVLEATYADGRTAEREVRYGENVLAYSDVTAVPDAPLAWQGLSRAGEPVGVRALVWSGHDPQQPIRTLTLRSGNSAGGLVVLAVTGLGLAK